MANERLSAGRHFALDIMGASAGFLRTFDGLAMEADIVTNDLGPENIQKKHVANVRWTPAKATAGIGMGKEISNAIRRAFEGQQKAFDGTLNVADFNYKIRSSLRFTGAVITSVTVPKLEGSSKEAAYFDLEWEAETVRWLKGDNSEIRRPTTKEKAWLCSNFRFEMGSLPCSRVATVQSFTWKCGVARDPLGEPTRRPAKVTVPDIKIEVSMADYDAWLQAATKWFVDGQHDETDEMSGAIVFLAPDLKTEMGRVTLEHCGFARSTRGTFDASSEKAARFSCEFYVESMKFVIRNDDDPK